MIKKLLIIGVGLIGGSLALALKKAAAVELVIGSGRNLLDLQKAVELGVIDSYEMDLKLAAIDADMIVLAVPVGAMEAVLQQISAYLKTDAVITDVGSTKANIIAAVQRVFAAMPANFVPGHPIAGTEKSGVEAGFAELFRQRRVVLTPLPETSAIALEKVRHMWESAGAEVVETDVQHHDQILAATSHLPHLLAFTLVDTLARMDESDEIFRFAAGGFRDFTRIAGSNPQMWHDISLANRSALLDVLDLFTNDLALLTEAVRNSDSAGLLDIFTRAKAARDRYAATLTSPAESQPTM